MSGRGKRRKLSSRDIGPVSAVRSRQVTADGIPPMTDPIVPRPTGSGVQEHNTGMSGGTASYSFVPGKVHLEQGATMKVDIHGDAVVEKIKARTTSKIQERTRGMVETEALITIMNKLASVNWLTIKGQAGEGKTTAAFMALDLLQQSGREVFQVETPDEFSKVIKEFSNVSTTSPPPVILLDDILGTLEFDQAEWSKWRQIIEGILDDREHTLYDNKSKKNEITVILVSRNYVLNNVFNDVGKVARYFTDNDHIVFMLNSGKRKTEEKVAILKAICESKGLKLDDYTIDRMCQVNGPHGFPHTCRLFVTLRKEGAEIDTEKFMESPLEFLNQTIQKFLDDSTKQLLFKEMIKRDGKLPVSEIENLDNSYVVRKLIDSLVDSYLRKEDDCFTFHHPSIYDSVAFNLTKYFPSFVIKHCSVSFLHERVRLEQSCDTHQSTSNRESNLVVNIPRCYITDIAKRFAAAIENRELMLVLSHKVLTDPLFIEELKCHVKLPPTSLLTLTDKQTHQSFLKLLVRNEVFELLKYLISFEPNLNARDKLDYTVLEYLCMYSPWTDDVMRFLIDKGASVNTADRSGQSPLHKACYYNKPHAVKWLLDHGADSNSGNMSAETPLHITVDWGSKDCIVELVNAGTDVNVQDTQGRTPLHKAVYSGYKDCIVELVNAGADVNVQDIQGYTPLHRAAYSGYKACIVELVNAGADVNVQDTLGATPLHIAAFKRYKSCIVELVNAGAEVNVQDTRGNTPLHIAAGSGYKDRVVELVNAGAIIDTPNTQGQTPLHTAVYKIRYSDIISLPDISVCQTLISHGAVINKQDTEGNTPLHLLCQVDSHTRIGKCYSCKLASVYKDLYRSLVTLLVDHGADREIQNNIGELALRGWCKTLTD